jgi:predicted nucleic acid-binding protein
VARYAILDTNVVIRHLKGELPHGLDEFSRRYVLRQSAVVLCELYRGARDRAAERALDGLARSSAEIWAPLAGDWLRAGPLVRAIGDDHGFDIHKRRELQNDCLIALTAHRHGALVLTGDIADFRLIKRRIDLEVQEV